MSECLCVSSFCDATLVIVDPRRGKRRNLKFAADRLRMVGGRVVGIVLNDVPRVRKTQARVPRHNIGDVRSALEENHIGWAMWDYRGNFGVVERTDTQITTDPAILRALGLNADAHPVTLTAH